MGNINQQTVAMGGGGFSMAETPLLDQYILRLSSKARPINL
jgi:hypothetical protein